MGIPNVAHFVFGFREQDEPFHLVHYLAIESCRQTLRPDAIYFHHQRLPWGRYWDLIRPHLTLVRVEAVPDVQGADYDERLVPPEYRYAHHADFVRLDALVEHGGVYADIDTLFVRPFPPELFDAPFVIGREPPVRDERTGAWRPSLCNAVLLGEPGSAMARAWRARMASELNGTWSNHSGFLAQALSEEMPDAVRVEPEARFFAFPGTPDGLRQLLQDDVPVPPEALSIHLWAHLWWQPGRTEYSSLSAADIDDAHVRAVDTTFTRLARPYLPAPVAW